MSMGQMWGLHNKVCDTKQHVKCFTTKLQYLQKANSLRNTGLLKASIRIVYPDLSALRLIKLHNMKSDIKQKQKKKDLSLT